MLYIYPVNIGKDLDRKCPLYVGHFFKLENMRWKKRKQRQGLIISMALAWYRLAQNNLRSPGFIEAEILITNLTRQVSDAKVILEHFFTIKKLGYNFGSESKSPTIISPKRLGQKMISAVEDIINDVHFEPEQMPVSKKLTESKVHVQSQNTDAIIEKLKLENREDLIAPVTWLLKQESPITFLFEPSGSLQARDKSVWPIKSIENWPGWLRKNLFGTVIDIENAFVQYLMQELQTKYSNNSALLSMRYPDLVRLHTDKTEFRKEICRDYFELPVSDQNIKVVKRVLMSLANGSNISGAMLVSGSNKSDAVDIIKASCPHMSATSQMKAGKRLSSIARQFRAARRDICIAKFKCKPTRANLRKVYHGYFDWERNVRYAMHKAVNGTGIHLHDGLDGVITDLSEEQLSTLIFELTSVRVSVEH